MAKYHTEGIVKSIELDGRNPKIKIEPGSPYKFSEKKNDGEQVRVLFVADKSGAPQSAFLAESGNAYSVEEGKVDFAALLVLKQNRTKVRFSADFDEATGAAPETIAIVEICE